VKKVCGVLARLAGRGRVLSLMLASSAVVADGLDASEINLEAEAKARIQPFANQLLETVQEAIRAQGAPKAVEACQLMAPQIADRHSHTEWQIGRTSLKLRNPNNAPDAWEQKVLQHFQQEIAQGKPAKELSFGEVVGADYRYMQAIVVGEPCLACHGEKIDPQVRATLQEHYPQDRAVGYRVGDLRGAFTLTLRNINKEPAR